MSVLLLDRRADDARGTFWENIRNVDNCEDSRPKWKVCVAGTPIQDVVGVLERFNRASFNALTPGIVFHPQGVGMRGETGQPDCHIAGFTKVEECY